MIVTIKSKVPLEINPNEIIESCGIENGMSDVVIRQRIREFLLESLNPPEDMDINIDDVTKTIACIVMENLAYYVTIRIGENDAKN